MFASQIVGHAFSRLDPNAINIVNENVVLCFHKKDDMNNNKKNVQRDIDFNILAIDLPHVFIIFGFDATHSNFSPEPEPPRPLTF